MPTVGFAHTKEVVPLRGTRGDGVPFDDIVLTYVYAEPVDKADFTVLAQLRATHASPDVAAAFAVELEDQSDDDTLEETHLRIRLRKLTGVQTRAMPLRKYVGDVEVTKAGEEPLTLIGFVLQLDPDVSRA